jgi:hypothetical protein
MWNSDDLDIPLEHLVAMFGLTESEVRKEGVSGRLRGKGRRTPAGFEDLNVSESAARDWLRSDMPKRLRRKVEAAGSYSQLERWRGVYFAHCHFDFRAGTITLPDGTIVEAVEINMRHEH